jgi:biofilm PGA synthesis protein PgaD
VGQPGQGDHGIGTSLIIDKASKRPRWARRVDWTLSVLMWLTYLFLVREALLDLIVLIKDTLEWALAGDDPPYLAAIMRFLHTLRNYAFVILANGAALLLWAFYNQIRFRERDLRKPPDPVTVEETARLFGLPADDLDSWRQSRILIMRHDSHGALLRVISVDPGVALSMKAEAASPPGA